MLGTILHAIVGKQAGSGMLAARSIDDDGAQFADCELGLSRPPLAEDGTLLFDPEMRKVSETYPCAEDKIGLAVQKEARNGPPLARVIPNGSVVRDITPQSGPLSQTQVSVNLLANAVRYTDAGGELKVWVHAREGQAVVHVRDSGIGIDPDALPYIFDLFTQANTAEPRSKGGLGIGLAVVRNLVELHGGTVTAASTGPGQGSEFTVHLPTQV